MQDENGYVTARPSALEQATKEQLLQQAASAASAQPPADQEQPPLPSSSSSKRAKKVNPIKEDPATVIPSTGFNVVLTHATADFDSLAAAVGLARLWTEDSKNSDDDKHHTQEVKINNQPQQQQQHDNNKHVNNHHDDHEEEQEAAAFSTSRVPTFVVLPRGAHPGVQRFLALHKHLFPIRSLKSLPNDLSGLNRLALVDAQRRDRLGPADVLLKHANRVTVVDHHVDQESDIAATDYVVDKVGSVSTLMTEHLQAAHVDLTEAEATLLALGIHADTGSLCFDSTTPRDAAALAWCLAQGASQAAIAEHAHPFLSREQQGVLTQALVNVNSTVVHGVTLSTVLLTADGFINGLAAVAQDALELSSSDVFLLGIVYEAQSGGRRKKKAKRQAGSLLTSRLLRANSGGGGSSGGGTTTTIVPPTNHSHGTSSSSSSTEQEEILTTHVLPDEAKRRMRLQQAFDRKDIDGSGYLELPEVAVALRTSGVVCTPETIESVFDAMDTNGDGRIDFEEFVQFATQVAVQQEEAQQKKSTTLILIGRAKAGSNLKNIKLNSVLERFGGGGHAKAASATVRLDREDEAPQILQGLVDELVETGLQEQLTVGDFMTAPVLSVKVDMTERQVEDLFTRYDVRALPVVDDKNDVIGLVSYKEVASAKVRKKERGARNIRAMPIRPTL